MHIPVLKNEVLHFLNPSSNDNFIDCTAGFGGHAFSILEKTNPEGKVLAFEWDEEVYAFLKEKESARFIPVNNSYTLLEETVKEKNFFPVAGVLFDLGFSSFHVDSSKRGFSFMRNELLDMRYNRNNPLTAREIVNSYKKKDIEYILKNWGEEDFAEKIAEKIIERRKDNLIETTQELVAIVEEVIPEKIKEKIKINVATKTFQAIRIAVNGELLGLKAGLSQALNVLQKRGRVVVICFHGGEERVLRSFVRSSDNCEMITGKPILPNQEEINKNIRSRSAKLYVLVKK